MLLGSNVLEFALGMIFFYFLLSTLCSTLNELIAGLFDWRTKELIQGIRDLLNLPLGTGSDDIPASAALAAIPLVRAKIGKFTAEVANAAYAIKSGAKVEPDAEEKLVKEGLARRAKNGALKLTWWDGRRAAQQGGETASEHAAALIQVSTGAAVDDGTSKQLIRSGLAEPDGPGKLRLTEVGRLVAGQTRLGDLVLRHPLIMGLSSDPSWLKRILVGHHFPSYIPDRTFSTAVLDTLATVVPAKSSARSTSVDSMLSGVNLAELPPQLQRALNPLIGVADDLDQARNNLENWYNAKMDRLRGQYKRWTQFVLLILAALTSIAINADSLAVGRALWQSPTLRQVIVAQVDQALAASEGEALEQTSPGDPRTRTEQQLREVQGQVQDILSFPVGWGAWCASPTTAPTPVIPNPPNCTPTTWWGWALKVAGFLVTTLAVSIGAPFWFDLLRKVADLRSSGPAPKEQASENAPRPTNR